MPTESRSARGVAALRVATLRIAELESELENAHAERKRLEEVELPAAFTEDGISELRLPDGQKAARAVTVQGSLPSADDRPTEREEALTWLSENGYRDTIRCAVTADYGLENYEAANTTFETLRGDNRAHVSKKESVHASTLKALVLQRVQAAQPTPLELLGCTIIRRVRLTTPPRARRNRSLEPEDL